MYIGKVNERFLFLGFGREVIWLVKVDRSDLQIVWIRNSRKQTNVKEKAKRNEPK